MAERVPCAQEVMDLNLAGFFPLLLFALFLSVVCPYVGPLRTCNATYSTMKIMLSCATWARPTLMYAKLAYELFDQAHM